MKMLVVIVVQALPCDVCLHHMASSTKLSTHAIVSSCFILTLRFSPSSTHVFHACSYPNTLPDGSTESMINDGDVCPGGQAVDTRTWVPTSPNPLVDLERSSLQPGCWRRSAVIALAGSTPGGAPAPAPPLENPPRPGWSLRAGSPPALSAVHACSQPPHTKYENRSLGYDYICTTTYVHTYTCTQLHAHLCCTCTSVHTLGRAHATIDINIHTQCIPYAQYPFLYTVQRTQSITHDA